MWIFCYNFSKELHILPVRKGTLFRTGFDFSRRHRKPPAYTPAAFCVRRSLRLYDEGIYDRFRGCAILS